ncbi:hypothetical protein AAHE18_11G089300 [Arachis hypogaea]
MRNQKERKLMRFMKAPFRLLIKARDMYVQGMTDCSASSHFAYVDAAMGCPTGQLCPLPRSFSVTSSARSSASDDHDLIMAAASLRRQERSGNGNMNEHSVVGRLGTRKVLRRCSMTIGRIDEDEACDFSGEDLEVKQRVFPRSTSYAAWRGRAVGIF